MSLSSIVAAYSGNHQQPISFIFVNSVKNVFSMNFDHIPPTMSGNYASDPRTGLRVCVCKPQVRNASFGDWTATPESETQLSSYPPYSFTFRESLQGRVSNGSQRSGNFDA